MLRAGFSAAMILIVGISVFSAYTLYQARTSLRDVVHKEQFAIEMQFRMLQAARERSIVLFRLVNADDPFDQDAYLIRFHDLAGGFLQAQQALMARENTEDIAEKALFDLQSRQIHESSSLLGEVIDLAMAGRKEAAVHLLVEKGMPAQDEAMSTLNSLIEHEILETHHRVETLRGEQEEKGLWLIVGGSFGIFLLVFISRFVGRRLDGLNEEISTTAHELEEANRQLEQQKLAMDQHDIVSISDIHGNITYVNDKFCEVSQYSRDELLGQNHRILKSCRHADGFFEEMWDTISSGRIWHGEVCNRKKNGSNYWVATTVVPFLDDAGLPYQYVAVRTEITPIMEAQQVLEHNREALEGLVQARTQELEEREDLLSSITMSAQEAVLMVSPEGRIAYWNPAAEKMFGYTEAEIVNGELCTMLVPPQYCETLQAAFEEFRQTGHGSMIGNTSEFTALRKGGEEFPLEISLSAVRIRGGWHAVGIARDITARKQAEQILEQMATTDALTGISNRRKFEEMLRIEHARAQRYSVPLSLIMFDVDHFKRINDTHGHPVGDAVLAEIAQLISCSIRETDMFARTGGEEFAILTPNCDMACACAFAEKLRVLVGAHVFPEVGQITCSFGVADHQDSEDKESLIKRADEALYQAKHTGRNKVAAGQQRGSSRKCS